MYAVPTRNEEKARQKGLRAMFHRNPRARMAPAIAELDIALNTMHTNIPINEREGDKAQARLERRNARSFSAAIDALAKL